jgi:predicted Zn-dependent protease
MITFFEGLVQDKKAPRTVLKYLSTHPTTDDRVEWLKALAARAAARPVKLLPDTDWGQVKQLCQTAGSAARPGEPGRAP